MALQMAGILLAPGRHVATLAEIEQTFVANAPYSSDRARIFTALGLFLGELKQSLPGTASVWVDGGFVTHKPWAAPSDVDLAVPVDAAEWNALPVSRQRELHTMPLSPTERIQPMAGLVDCFVFDPINPLLSAYWHRWWSHVTDASKNEVPGAVKGYLEVTL